MVSIITDLLEIIMEDLNSVDIKVSLKQHTLMEEGATMTEEVFIMMEAIIMAEEVICIIIVVEEIIVEGEIPDITITDIIDFIRIIC
jgi:hypothetical protein